MKYIVADIDKARKAGIDPVYHRQNDHQVILTEKELLSCQQLENHPSLQEKADAVAGKIYSRTELINEINNKGLKI